MKILWANANLLHPTTKGGQIRTLETLRILHKRHEIHYVTFVDDDPSGAEGVRAASEYCSRLHTLPRRLVSKTSPRFALDLAAGVFHPMPIAVRRYYDPAMARLIGELLARESFDRAVCDFLVPAAHCPDLSRCLFFAHNVETLIWRRHAETAADPVRRWYFGLQAKKMFRYEGQVARQAGHIVAVSAKEAELFQSMFGAAGAAYTATGVNLDYFTPPDPLPECPAHDLVFVGSMDYLPNIDGVSWFVRDILPLIRRQRPETTLAVVGRSPSSAVCELAQEAGGVTVTGTVPDVRPYLWGAALSFTDRGRHTAEDLRIDGGADADSEYDDRGGRAGYRSAAQYPAGGYGGRLRQPDTGAAGGCRHPACNRRSCLEHGGKPVYLAKDRGAV